MRDRLSDYISLKCSPQFRAKMESAAESRELSISELARSYIRDGLIRDGVGAL